MTKRISRKKQTGLTLVELLSTISILAVVNATAGPTLSDTIKRNRLSNEADRILTTLNLARSEAVKRNLSVSICRSSDGATCTGSWEDGWIVFANADGDNTVDSGVDEVIRVYDGPVKGYSLTGTIGTSAITYFSDGSYSGGSDSVQICSADADLEASWTVAINTVGRPRAHKGTSSCA
jgi:type IV fimbrial biogenesis protein FimT